MPYKMDKDNFSNSLSRSIGKYIDDTESQESIMAVLRSKINKIHTSQDILDAKDDMVKLTDDIFSNDINKKTIISIINSKFTSLHSDVICNDIINDIVAALSEHLNGTIEDDQTIDSAVAMFIELVKDDVDNNVIEKYTKELKLRLQAKSV